MKTKSFRAAKRPAQSQAQRAKLQPAPMENRYLPEEPEDEGKSKISVRLADDDADDLHRVAKIWAEYSKKPETGASLAREFILAGLREAWKGVGGRPDDADLPQVIVHSPRNVEVQWSKSALDRAFAVISKKRREKPHCPHCDSELGPDSIVYK